MTVRMRYGDALRSICDDAGVAVKSSVIDDLVRERQGAKAVPFLDVDTAVVAMLDELAALAAPMAVLSNCSGEEVEMLADSEIGSRIAHQLLPCDIGCAKPAREAYLTAAEQLRLAPENCLFVGDGSFDELLGARAAGMRPIWATWFMPGWPPALAATQEAVIAEQRVERALTPSDVVAVVRHAIGTPA
jgi:FMN phosphatase YigB (HAD superfamily)